MFKDHNQSGLINIFAIIILILTIVGILYTYSVYQQAHRISSPNQDRCTLMECEFGCDHNQCLAKPTATPDPTLNWKTYTDQTLRFTFQYPPEDGQPSRMMGDTSFAVIYKATNGEKFGIYQGYIAPQQRSVMGVSYCEANRTDTSRCETRVIGGKSSTIDWNVPVEYNDYTSGKQEKKIQIHGNVWIPDTNGGMVTFDVAPISSESKQSLDKILATFKFTD